MLTVDDFQVDWAPARPAFPAPAGSQDTTDSDHPTDPAFAPTRPASSGPTPSGLIPSGPTPSGPEPTRPGPGADRPSGWALGTLLQVSAPAWEVAL